MPLFKHHCDDCVELGQFDDWDFYYCPQTRIGAPTLIGRFGNEPQEFDTFNATLAGRPSPEASDRWHAAYWTARMRGLTFEQR